MSLFAICNLFRLLNITKRPKLKRVIPPFPNLARNISCCARSTIYNLRCYKNRLIESNFVMFNRQIHVPKYTVLNIISNSLIINELYIEKCVLLTGGLEVSFSIVSFLNCLPDTLLI